MKIIQILAAALVMASITHAESPEVKLLDMKAQRLAEQKVSTTGQERARAVIEYQATKDALAKRREEERTKKRPTY